MLAPLSCTGPSTLVPLNRWAQTDPLNEPQSEVTMFHRRNQLFVKDGRVFCARKGGDIDVEACFSCSFQHGLSSSGGRAEQVICKGRTDETWEALLLMP